MENTYGIGITNRFELFLDDESDPFETIKLKEQEKELKKKNKVAEKENKVKSEPPAKPKPPVQKKPKEVPAQQPNKPQENRRDGGESGFVKDSAIHGTCDFVLKVLFMRRNKKKTFIFGV